MDELERLWNETGNFIAKGEGGYVILANSTTTAYYPVDFNGLNDNNQIVVDSLPLVKVAMMFWRPDANPESIHLWLSWLKSEGMNIKLANQDLSSNLLQFRSANKERLFAIARTILSNKFNAPTPTAHSITVRVKPKSKPKPIHKNSAVVGTAIATPIIASLSAIYHVLPAPVGTAIVGIVAFILSIVEHTSYKQLLEEIES